MNHNQIYDVEFGCRDCELTGSPYSDIHHIDARGMGGRKSMDRIDNLMALRRDAHDYFGDKKQFKTWLKEWHSEYMSHRTPMYIERSDDPIFKEFLKQQYDRHF